MRTQGNTVETHLFLACRRRKQKCDGGRPCSTCTRRNSSCLYRAINRHRGRQRLSAGNSPSHHQQTHSTAARQSHNVPVQTDPTVPARVHIFNNIRATHEASGTEAYYGASSTLSLLLHIDDHLTNRTRPGTRSAPHNIEDQDGTESIMRYNYQSIAFNTLPRPKRSAAHHLIISHVSAKRFLRNFILGDINRAPFLKAERLWASLDCFYQLDGEAQISPSERSLVIIALAIGTIPTSSHTERKYLLDQAHAESEKMMYDISLHAVQVSLLMAYCEFEIGNPNNCYLQLGVAIRKAFASGIHRAKLPEAQQTMWTLFCNETLICVKLGRPYGLTEDDVPSISSETGYTGTFSLLCTIIRSAYKIYCHKDTSITDDLEQANALYRRIREFSLKAKQDINLDIGAQFYTLDGANLYWHISMSYCIISSSYCRRHARLIFSQCIISRF